MVIPVIIMGGILPASRGDAPETAIIIEERRTTSRSRRPPTALVPPFTL
jgi:hypothetical protein